jgi:beta-phosphoglucomutase
MSAARRNEAAVRRGFQGAIFDVDGVLVDSPHEQAWRESLRDLMTSEWRDIRDVTTWSPGAFTSGVYQQHASGKPRMSGARATLEYFRVPDPDGARVRAYADRKQARVVELIEAGKFDAFPDGLRFIAAVKDAGLRVAAASSSKNARLYLRKIPVSARPGLTLLDLFDVDVSGREFARGKPDPEMFLTAARELDVDPHRAIVVEDAEAGVQAAKAGGMVGLGVARADDAELLAAAGADLVVASLDEVDLDVLSEGRLRQKP